MKRHIHKWTSYVLSFALLFSLLPPLTANAAATRITITYPYVAASVVNGQPASTENNNIPRSTSNPITVTATVEGISDAQIPSLYLEITNVNTGATVVDKTNKAFHQPGSFDVSFSNVALTEGLNKITIKIGESSVVESAPAWIYYTPTTNIADLSVDGKPFSENTMYPENPLDSTTVSISGMAPNASEVQAYLLGDSMPKNAYFNNGAFFFIADDINKTNSTTPFKLTPGDNQLTIIAKNNSKTYQVEKNFVYDNGNPFAFGATIQEVGGSTELKKLITTPTVATPKVKISALLKDDVNAIGDVQYRYVDVNIGGKRFGPYDLKGAAAATTASALYPTTLNQGYSETLISVVGTGLDGSVSVSYEDNVGNASPADLVSSYVNADQTVRLFTLPAGALVQANAPYKFIVKKGTDVLNEFAVQVVDPGSVLPTVDVSTTEGSLAGLEQGNLPASSAVTFSGAIATASMMRVDFTDYTGQVMYGTANGNGGDGTNVISYTLPAGLQQGLYKMKIAYAGNVLTERQFAIGAQIPAAPTVTAFASSLNIPNFSAIATLPPATPVPTYITVNGTGFSTDLANITNAQLVDDGGVQASVTLTPFDVLDNRIIFQLPNQSSLIAGTTYDLNFTAGTTPLTVDKAVISTGLVDDGTTYDGVVVTSANPLQYSTDELTAGAKVTFQGLDLDQSNIQVQLSGDDGSSPSLVTLNAVSPTQANISLPTSLAAGVYNIKITTVVGSTETVLAQYPLSIINPSMVGLNPAVKPISDVTTNTMKINGSNLGWFESDPLLGMVPHLKLRFTSDENPSAPVNEMPVTDINGSTAATFGLPNLPEGSYTVALLYNGQETSSSLKYTVSSPPASLKENAAWSKAGRYKVFEFNTDELSIPADKYQAIEFKFYNFSSDEVQPTTFYFNYMDPSLPYIEHLNRDSDVLVNETAPNEINELPATFKVYANTKTKKVNIYLGDYPTNKNPDYYDNSSVIDPAVPGSNMFEFTLDGLPNGATKLTIVPSTTTTVGKSGENPPGKKTYDFNITSTPYVILNNVYNGMVVKNPVSEITCTKGGALKGKCISGRLVNVPVTEQDDVEVYVNDQKTNMTAVDFTDSAQGLFGLELGKVVAPDRGLEFDFNAADGKNTVKFRIYHTVNGIKQLATEATFEVFIFSKEVSEFMSIRPIETTDVVKFVPSSQADTYVTSENKVSFSGAFANATEIKVTARLLDDNGQPDPRYDRRYNNFTLPDPVNGNPGYFAKVNSPAGQFTTNLMPLNKTGDTIFDFTITNESKIQVTKSITVRREPKAYDIIYPTLVRNTKGEFQAFINSNYVEVELRAENADSIKFGKEEAIKREVTNSDGTKEIHFFYELSNLKAGKNNIKFTVVRGSETQKGSFDLFNADTAVEGAQYKSPLKSKLSVFNKLVQLSFPKGSNFMRNDPGAINQYLTADRQILFGIANDEDGRVDKIKHPASYDGQIGNPNPIISSGAKLLLQDPTGRFRPAGQLIWIDAGTIARNESDLNKAYNGSGRLPYDTETFYNRSKDDLVVPTKNGTLTLQYDQNIRDDAWKYISVYHYDIYEDSTGVVKPGWKNVGGVVNTRNNTITVPFETFGYYQVMYMDQSFDDVTAHPWARNDLDTLYAKGIMLPKAPPANFVPNDPITRGEFATMLVKIFDIPLNYTETPTFTDVLRVNPLSNGLYDYKYIETAARAGIIRGTGGGRFMPDSTITRQDAAVMIAKAGNYKLGTAEEKTLKNLQKQFTDAASIELYSRAAVEAVVKAKLIAGKENVLLAGQKATFRFDPKENLSRAEAAIIAINVLRQAKKIPK